MGKQGAQEHDKQQWLTVKHKKEKGTDAHNGETMETNTRNKTNQHIRKPQRNATHNEQQQKTMNDEEQQRTTMRRTTKP